eukprot:10793206-Karenia_brevis.AAC.1
MTYHAFLEDQLVKMQAARTDLSVPETLHVTHVLIESVRGAILGLNETKEARQWTRHLLHNKKHDAESGRIAYFLRVEFQDGTRKAPTQDYHGSGRPHTHWVMCAEKPESISLHTVASASMDHPEPLR